MKYLWSPRLQIWNDQSVLEVLSASILLRYLKTNSEKH